MTDIYNISVKTTYLAHGGVNGRGGYLRPMKTRFFVSVGRFVKSDVRNYIRKLEQKYRLGVDIIEEKNGLMNFKLYITVDGSDSDVNRFMKDLHAAAQEYNKDEVE